MSEWSWYAGSSNEFYQLGPFKERDQAIIAAAANEYSYICEAILMPIKLDVGDLIDSQYFDADDLFNYDWGEVPDRIKDSEAADKELQSLLDDWVQKWAHTFISPNIFASTRNEEVLS